MSTNRNHAGNGRATELERDVLLLLVQRQNRPDSLHDFISEATRLLLDRTGCDAVGIRLRERNDYPYYETKGFPEQFVRRENSLISTGIGGKEPREPNPDPLLECMCGSVIQGRTNPDLPFFTRTGSFWTGSTTELLAQTDEESLPVGKRNRCNVEGYETVVLVPLCHGREIVGLLQMNDSRRHWFDESDIALYERVAETLALGVVRNREFEALRRSEQLLKKSQSIASIGSWHFDLISNRLTWSEEVFRIFGLNPREFEASYETFLDRVHPDDRDRIHAVYRSALQGDSEPCEMEHRIIRADTGEIRYVYQKCEHVRDGSGRVICSEGIVHDVTERKRTEAELRENEEKFQALIDQTADMLFLHDFEGNILDVNQRAVDQSGYSREELLSMRVSDLDPDFHAREQGGKFWEKFAVNRPYSFEARHRRKDGTVFPVEVTLSKIRLGNALRIMGLARDITERKEYEDALIQAKEQAEVANRAKSDFLARMSHEIRTPMNSVLGMLRLVLMGHLPDSQRERIRVARESADSLLWLLNDLLDLSRIEAGKFSLQEEPFNLRSVLDNILKEMELPATEKGLTLSSSLAQALPENVVGDPHRLKQIIRNLLNNAVKYTERGWICLRVYPADAASDCEGEPRGANRVIFEVSDTGKGIDAESLETVFDFYDQGKHALLSPEQGTGLGLAICRKLSEQMGGAIWAESAPGEGSTFFVRLPFRTQRERTFVERPGTEAERVEALPPLRILLAEDQRMNQIFTVDLLTTYGHTVEVAENGQQVLEKLAREHFDLVLMDLKMPIMDGIEATMRIRTAQPDRMSPDIPIIGLSAHAAPEEEVERIRSVGLDDYVIKPVSFEKLFGAISRLWV